MDFKRIAGHLAVTPGRLRRALPAEGLAAIEKAIAASEGRHAGQIRFAVEASLDLAPLIRGQSARDRAIELFAHLRVWDTEHNSGVLIYLLLADRSIEIVADRGVQAKTSQQELESICRGMELACRQGRFCDGVIGAIDELSGHLVKHFPAVKGGRNELPDAPAFV